MTSHFLNAPCFEMPCAQARSVRLSTSENGPRWGCSTSCCSIHKQNWRTRSFDLKPRLTRGDLSSTGTGSLDTTDPCSRKPTPMVPAMSQACSVESRRAVLQAGLAGVVAGLGLVAHPAAAQMALRSRTCDTPCTLTIQNGAINQFLHVYWLNYDGAHSSGLHAERL